MAAYNKFQAFAEDLAEGKHDLGADTLKVMLVSSPAPVATNAVKADLTEISPGNGYAAGGEQATVSSSAQSAGVYRLVVADITWVAGGGTIGPFRYPVFYNDTPSSPADPLIAWHDYGTNLTLQDGETFSWDVDATNGILTIT